MATESDDELEGPEDFIEVPSCIESLTSSAGQLRQLAHQATSYYGKLLLCYGCTSESSSLFAQVRERAAAPRQVQACSCCRATRLVPPGQTSKSSSNQARHRDTRGGQMDLKRVLRDRRELESLDKLVDILPCLNEVCAFVERCSMTIEATVKRITYYLNLATQRDKRPPIVKQETFELTPDARLDAVFISLMDLIFALVSLERTLCDRTTIQDDLNLIGAICRHLDTNPADLELLVDLKGDTGSKDKDEGGQEGQTGALTKENLTRLNEYLDTIRLTLGLAGGASAAIFRQCIEHVQHLSLSLSKERTQSGFKYFERLFAEFLVFYADHLVNVPTQNYDLAKCNIKVARTVATVLMDTNVIPTLYMDTHPRKLLGLVGLNILYSSLFNKSERRVSRALNQALQRTKCHNLILLEGSHCHLLLDEFLQSHMSRLSVERKSLDHLAGRLDLLLKLDTSLEFEQLSLRSLAWLSHLKSELVDSMHELSPGWPKRQVLLLDQGVRLFEELSTTIGGVFAAHQHRLVDVSKSNLVGLYRMIALLKSLRASLIDNLESFMANTLVRLEHFIRVRWRELFDALQKRQIMMSYTERKLELMWTMKLASVVSESEMMTSALGRITQSICLPMLMAVLEPQELHELNQLLELLRLNLLERIGSFADCGQLYWHLATLDTYYVHAFEELQGGARELNALHAALDDVAHLFDVSQPRPGWSTLDLGWLTARRDRYLETLSRELVEQFELDYLDRVCQELEVELRLQIHRELYTDSQINPYRRRVYNFKEILEAHDGLPVVFRILGRRVNLKRRVEHHLNAVCYNLSAIATHDWLTYDNMMSLARHKYRLRFVETQLPVQTLDSSLDLLDIIRNLALFASRYSYDLTQQSFLEKCPNRTLSSGSTIASVTSSFAPTSSNQTLNVLQIEHVAHSIQTHGYGILDSAVNCTYQTLKRLVEVFARQLSDGTLRAVLQREHQQMVNEFRVKRASHWTISFDKANRVARKFKLSASSLTESMSLANSGQQQQVPRPGIDLDSIRQTVTQLGNLMAFVRLIKSGALNCASRTVDYVPELADLFSLRLSACAETEFQHYAATFPSLLRAAQNFDQCLEDLENNFLPKTNYSKIIVGLFRGLLSPSTVSQGQASCRRDTPEESVSGVGRASPGDEAREETDPKPTEPMAANSKQTATHHLELFFLLVPALTINYIDYLINCKERVASRSSAARLGALLSDDGFAIGVAFLLTVLDQTAKFGKLNWLAQTCAKLGEEIEQVEALLRDPKYEESLRQTSSMTLRRLRRLHSEYAALDNTLTCALLLFENLTL